MKIYNRIVIDMETGATLEEDSFEYAGPVAGYKKLWMSILQAAVQDIKKGTYWDMENARRWFKEKTDTGVTSFPGICSALGIDPAYVLRELEGYI